MSKLRLQNKLYIFFAIMLATITVSCNDKDSGSTYPDNICTDFATFVSTSDDGSVFTLRKDSDSPLVTLTANIKVDTSQLKPDTRVIIQYVPSGGQAPYESGPITLYAIGQITNGGIDPQPLSTIESWPYDIIKIISMTRSGEYLDIWAQGDYSAKITRFCLAADESTLDDAYPQLYLVFEGDNGIGYLHQLYASFNLSDVWNKSTCEGVIVNYKSSGTPGSLTLTKRLQINPN